ncbi:unnamed protein product [Cuscuta epithymum]|uniref:Leucine-rich repeat-containing N-terminal plant-type domain-containing protein n=1 Tax=Cuscuta epithymum TaxID=186058 RepID=A0AAV0D246_9ASTE|nr:unnamed protein product [Cuscuta epithymum]
MAQAVSYAAALILACFTSFVSPDAQGVALSALKASLNASSSELTDWYESEVNPCTWSKITCDATNNVIMVSLPNMGFSGTLSPSIGVLKKLNALLLKGNGITGSIPEEIGNLSSLTTLDLQNNKLSGAIPTSLANLKKLQFLYLNQNNLTGKIPESLSSLPSLINLQLDTNGLTGQIPAQLFQVPKFNDSDLARDVDDCKSTTGFVFLMGNTAFTWSSKKQPIVTLSTCEAEYVAANSCVCHAIWLRNLFKEIGMTQKEAMKIFVDNKSTIALGKNPVFYDMSKHIDTRYHYIRECIERKEVEVRYVRSHDQIADIFTKPLKHKDFRMLRTMLGVTKQV